MNRKNTIGPRDLGDELVAHIAFCDGLCVRGAQAWDEAVEWWADYMVANYGPLYVSSN
jgi:hypothetical protein